MFACNYMVAMVRAITQEVDACARESATALYHKHVDITKVGLAIETAK
jgi:hypothetical protein